MKVFLEQVQVMHRKQLQTTKPIWIQNAAQLITLASDRKGPRVKEQMSELAIIEGGSMWIEDGVIQQVGTMQELIKTCMPRAHEAQIVDATGKIITPGLIDPHTHIVFGGSREFEFEMRIEGKSYMEIMNAGGGIHATMRKTREMSEEQIYNETAYRLDSFLKHGVTTLESKSGYGLNVETELKQLRIMQRLNNKHPIEIIPTFMGAHAVPEEFAGEADAYIDYVIEEMLPTVTKEKLAVFCDVFLEKDVFTPEQAERVLMAGKEYGLIPKIHADEIVACQGAEIAAKVGAITADHLLKTSNEGFEMLAKNGVIACLLPVTALYLREQPARAREMITAGVPVAISTDCNPGTAPTTSMLLAMNLACITMNMTPAETLCAATYNAACAIGMEEKIGSLEVGKQADFVIWDVSNYQKMHYVFGVNHVEQVWKKGAKVVG
ncbi:imidazolonepropionase [Solibacillus sp. CAU 1738]|uniref:imidazolonepropionase n=1 Tax=Solibacillus sp. CAU 1738 TaxID=3140363 RepID=UPI00326025B5